MAKGRLKIFFTAHQVREATKNLSHSARIFIPSRHDLGVRQKTSKGPLLLSASSRGNSCTSNREFEANPFLQSQV
jgi:hypothetical protein